MIGQLNPAYLPGGAATPATQETSPGIIRYAASPVAPQVLTSSPLVTAQPALVRQPLVSSEQPAAIGPGVAAPGCMGTDLAVALMQCIGDPTGAGCAALLTPANLALPLCPGAPPPPLPACLDPSMLAGTQYCDQYGMSGPNPSANAVCFLAQKNPAWYAALKALPPCAGTPGPTPTTPSDTTHKLVMWGGILLAIAAVGGAAWYFTKKRHTPNRRSKRYGKNRKR